MRLSWRTASATGRAADDWYRSGRWDAAARSEFERRLANARPHNRAQYRRIKAVSLGGARDDGRRRVAIELWAQTVVDPDAAEFERVMALSLMSELEQRMGRLEDAERHLRDLLARVQRAGDPSGTSGEEEIRLAEMLLEKGGAQHVPEAKSLLDGRANEMPLFLKSRFRLCVAQARASLALGDEALAKTWATAALDLAAMTSSGLANHFDLGLVVADRQTISWLRRVASDPTNRS